MGCRSTVFGREPWINTIIGGVASSIPTKAALATKLAISESNIKRFEIIGSDVRAHISSSYGIPADAFNADSTITYYNDIRGKVVGINARAFYMSSIQWAALRESTVVGGSSFQSTLSLNYITGGNFSLIEVNGIRGSNISSFDFSKVTRIEAYGIGETKFVNITAPLLTSMAGNQELRGISTLQTFIAPELHTIGGKASVFRSLGSATLLSMRKLKVFGNPAINDSTFANLKTGCIIEVNIALATSNSGSADAALAWVKANRAAIVKFYDDAGNYVSTL